MPSTELLPANSAMGAVTLWVSDLDEMIKFYQNGVGLTLLSEENGKATLGHGHNLILILEQKKVSNTPHQEMPGSFIRQFFFRLNQL